MLLLLFVAAIVSESLAAWCPEACRCDRSTTGELEVVCPASQDVAFLSVNVKPMESVQFQCTRAARPEDYSLLNGLKIGQVPDLTFVQCPLPTTSLLNMTAAFGVESITSILFQSFTNLSYALKQAHLQGLTNVTRLRLSSNNLTYLPENLLNDLPNLTSLDLRDNNLEKLTKAFFDRVPLLTTLELGNNRLQDLEPGVFQSLAQLNRLNLWSNRLNNVSGSIFKSLFNLESLDLHSNDFETLPPNLFEDLKNVITLNLFGNNFSSLPSELFSRTPSLRYFRLYNNQQQLNLPSRLLAGLEDLEEVYLMKNNLKELPADLFADSFAISNLSLSGNYLVALHQQLLQDQRQLLMLDLSYNNLVTLPSTLFRNLSELRTLRLGHNKLTNITRELFKGLKNLIELDLEHNLLAYVDSAALADLISLQQARLSHNNLSFLNENGYPQGGLQYTDVFGNRSPFHPCVNLEQLYLANNSITEVFYDWRIVLVKLRVLDLSFNRIRLLQAEDVHFIPPAVSIDLRNNEISQVFLYDLPTLVMIQDGGISSIRNNDNKRKRPRIQLENNPLRCDCYSFSLAQYVHSMMPPEVYAFVEIVPGNLRCSTPRQLSNRLFSEVMPMELVCNLPNGCPSPCDCLIRPFDRALIVNCSSRGLTQIPESLPMVSYLNHTELLLDGNQLVRLPNRTLSGYDNVTHLYLDNNHLEAISPLFLNEQINVLTLDHNNLTQAPSVMLKTLSNATMLRLLTLHSNPWACDCSTRQFLSWLQLRFKKIPFFGNITCADGRILVKLSAGELCPAPFGLVLGCVVIAAFGIIAGAVAAFYFRYNHAIRVWLYAHHWCLWLVTEEELDKHKRYDAFVSFSHKDEDFVVNVLVPKLEGKGLKLCVHYRDWVAGEWIPNQIARSVEDSRRTLVVLSPNFLDSVWGRLEFRAAHKQALSEGRARVVMLLYGDLPPQDQLDPELRAYISVNTYVKWGDPWFWDKLNYALPHAPLPQRKRKVEDRIELIRPAESPANTPTTPPANIPFVKTVLHSPEPCLVQAVT